MTTAGAPAGEAKKEYSVRARADDITWRTVDGETVILDLRDSSYLRTNRSGALLWERLQSDCEAAELVQTLTEVYGIDDERAARDVATFLKCLEESELLVAPPLGDPSDPVLPH